MKPRDFVKQGKTVTHVLDDVVAEIVGLALDAAEGFSYLIHDGGDVMPSSDVVKWFGRQFEVEE